MIDSDTVLPAIVLAAVLGFVIAAIIVIFMQRKPVSVTEEQNSRSQDNADPKQNLNDVKSGQFSSNKSRHDKAKGRANKEGNLTHPLLITSLKGHTGPVLALDHSTCGKYLASTAEDRTVRIWKTKDIFEKEHRYTRANVELDHATSVGFSPDSRAFIASLAIENTVRVFKLSKKKDGSASGFTVTTEFDFPKEHKGEIIYAGVAVNGKFVMTISKDTKMIIWSLKGDVLATIDTLQVSNSYGGISPCGNLVASSGFTPDVKLWNVEFDKSSIFKQVTKALELKGHSSGVYSFSFSSDSKRVATVSKDGSWRIYDIDVDYKRGQESYLIATGNYSKCFTNGESISHATVAISPDGYCIALAVGKCIGLFNAYTKQLEQMLSDVHSGDIVALSWSSSSHELTSAGGSDRMIRVWHNPTGAHALIADLKSKLPRAKTDLIRVRFDTVLLQPRFHVRACAYLDSRTTWERIQNQIKSARAYLSSIGFKE